MMPNLGSRKKDNVTRMERHIEDLPQLSNEMQLSIMNKVKSGELSIEDALNEARKDGRQQHKNKIVSEEELKPSQYNFSVHKHSHHRWQKRVLQIDFKTKLLCSIEKGIIKRQLSFSIVKSCDDGEGSKFTISFKGHHDYELEATSLEDKHKMMQLVNQIIYGNIYSDDTETCQQSQASQSLQEGVLLLHRGGLASFKWVRYDAKLHPGQLTLVPFRRRDDAELPSTVPLSIVIHLSDGDTSVLKSHGSDTFTLITHKNEYPFRVPSSDQITSPGATQRQRDAWVQAIDKLCSDWKRKSMGEHTPVRKTGLQHLSIAEDAEDTHTDLQTTGGSGGENMTYPPVDYGNPDSMSGVGDYLSAGDMSQSDPSAIYAKPYPKPRSPKKAILPPVQLPTTPEIFASSQPNSPQPSPSNPALRPAVPESPNHESGSAFVKIPAPPLPPPPLFNFTKNYRKPKTKAFHWDLVGPEKIATSFWTQESTRRIEIDTLRLYEQFAVKDLGTAGVIELSNRPAQNIMLNHKIAQNFNIFLKSFPVQPGELKDKLFIVNEEDGGLSDEHITSLRRYVPTVGDVEMYVSYKGPVTELHIVDQYMMEMCNIPRLSTQLDLLLTLRELPISMEDLQPLINQKIKMCMQLNNCRSFVSVLEYLLAIGNYLNENARREKAKGFRLSSLTKLTQLRGKDRKFTLLHALVEQIMLHEPCLATFMQELAEFDTVPGASIKGLTAEVDVLKNELQKVIQYRKTYNKMNAGAHPNFSKDLKVVIEKYNTDLSALTKTCEEMKKLYSVILVKFGEPANQDSKELFGLICEFIHDFKEVHAEMI